MRKIFLTILSVVMLAVLSMPHKAEACSRVVYKGDSTLCIVGRSLDWKTPIPTNIYVYPRGIKKESSDKPGAFTWTSRYGAVYAVSYDAGITEGMNEKGLAVNALFCKPAVYSNNETSGRAPVSLAVFVAWLLDNNATTAEVVEMVKDQNFTLSGSSFDSGTETKLHFAVTDATGETALLEFTDGFLRVYNPGDIHCFTNDPEWPQMKAIVDYWKKVGGVNMLPGTVKSPDRCVRGNFFIDNVVHTGDAEVAFPIVRSVMMNVSVPYLYTVDSEPNVSSTQWRSFCNLRDKLYYFDMAVNLGVYYIDLGKIDLRKGAPVLKLLTAEHRNITGDANKYLVRTKPFVPIH